MIHMSTNNKSFIETAQQLKDKGISNCWFMLQLNNPELELIDARSNDLSKEEIDAVIKECITNPWYFLREVVLIPDGPAQPVPFELHLGNLATLSMFFKGIDTYTCTPRFTYKTKSILAGLLWGFIFGCKEEFAFIAKDIVHARINISKISQIWEVLPEYLQDHKIFKYLEDVLENTFSGNTISTVSASRNVDTAHAIGRGLAHPVEFFDDFEFIPNMYHTIASSNTAYTVASRRARDQGRLHGRIYASTPADLSTKEARVAIDIIQCAAKFDEKMYDMSDDELESYIIDKSLNKIVYIEYDYDELRKDEKWLEEMCKGLNWKTDTIRREVLLERFISRKLDGRPRKQLPNHLLANMDVEMGSITDGQLDMYGIISEHERAIVKEMYAKHPKGFFPNPYCALR